MTARGNSERLSGSAPAAAPLDWAGGDPATLRRAYKILRPGRLGPRERWRVLAGAPDVKVLVHRPHRTRRAPLKVLYFHGGGWFVGSPLSHADIARGLCEASDLEVWSVDYRLLPGHAAMAPIRDGLAVARRLLARDRALRLVLAGDSAGAAIALAVAQALGTRERGRLIGLLAFYGGYGLTDSPSISAYGRREDGLDRASLESLYQRLGGQEGAHPFTVANLSRRRLPPTALFVGDRDPLLADSLVLHAALLDRGGACTLTVVPGVGHSYLHGGDTDDAARQTICNASASIALWRKCVRQPRTATRMPLSSQKLLLGTA